MRLTPKRKEELLLARRILLRWSKKNGRQFYWRTEDREPYQVLVSEFMLQQTQASRVREYLPRFLKLFPTSQKLANAKSSNVIRAWQGLGYNRRALNLQKAAQVIVSEHHNIFPTQEDELLALPGVGLYTARAIQAFAYNKPVSVVDVNVERVISRMTKKMKIFSEMLSHDEIHTINLAILPKRSSRIWHEALMDLGATICIKRNPKCEVCPIADYCASARMIKSTSNEKKESTEHIFFGQPKRIWRGRILKIISSSHRIMVNDLIQHLPNSHLHEAAEFRTFIDGILVDLTREGFCASDSKHRYSLSD